MTIWAASVGEILDLSADALVCSANPQLNLSGGVGGELLLRYGNAMQTILHDWLKESGRKAVPPGTVVVTPACGSPYQVVLHAVAIDAFYDTSTEVIRRTYEEAFSLASQNGCRTVVAACLACGYGRATPQMLVTAIGPMLGALIPNVDRIEFRSTNSEIVEAIQTALASA